MEQLVAESTGKHGRGVVPVVETADAEPAAGTDRAVVTVEIGDADPAMDALRRRMQAAGVPTYQIRLPNTLALGGEFFRWEFATAAAGWLLGVNPFDEPNVQQAKDATRRLLEVYTNRGRLPSDDVEQLGGGLARAGYTVVSGLARGIDAAAHEGALSTGTVAVLGGGVDDIYPPEHADLYARVVDQGCVVSESPIGARAQARDFPRRNRIISGLSLGTLVVEAALGSGSLITARQALEGLRAAVAALNQDAATRVSRQQQGVERKPVARDALARKLDAIARTARMIAKTIPGFDEPFQLPRPVKYEGFDEPFQLPRPVKYAVVLTAGHAFLRDAEPLAAQFIAHGMAADFVDDLRKALTAFEEAHAEREAGVVARSSAREGVRNAVKAANAAVNTIDLIVRYQHTADSEMQSAWQRARLLGGRRARKATTPKEPITTAQGTDAANKPAA